MSACQLLLVRTCTSCLCRIVRTGTNRYRTGIAPISHVPPPAAQYAHHMSAHMYVYHRYAYIFLKCYVYKKWVPSVFWYSVANTATT